MRKILASQALTWLSGVVHRSEPPEKAIADIEDDASTSGDTAEQAPADWRCSDE